VDELLPFPRGGFGLADDDLLAPGAGRPLAGLALLPGFLAGDPFWLAEPLPVGLADPDRLLAGRLGDDFWGGF
jgi:hypothetical protein